MGNSNVTQFPIIPYSPYQRYFRFLRVNPVNAIASVTPDTLPRGLDANIPVLQEPRDNVIVEQLLQQPRSYRASTSSSALLCNPPVSGYHQSAMSRLHISDAPFQPMIVEQSGYSQPQPSQNRSTSGFHSASHHPPIGWERTSRPGSFQSGITFRPTFRPQSKVQAILVETTLNSNPLLMYTIQEGHFHHLINSQQQPLGDVHYPRRTLPPSGHPQQQPMGNFDYPRRTLPPSDKPQQQPMGDVNYPRRTFPPSDQLSTPTHG